MFNSSRFLLSFLHAYEPRRGGALSHAKLFIARPLGSTDSRGYVYVGSHNLSHAAWGTVTLKKKTQDFGGMAATYRNTIDVTDNRNRVKKANKPTKIIHSEQREIDDQERVGNSKEGVMTLAMRNWELGVVVPLEDLKKKGTGRRKVMGAREEDMFKFVPWQRPVRSFRQGEKPYVSSYEVYFYCDVYISLFSLAHSLCFITASRAPSKCISRQSTGSCLK